MFELCPWRLVGGDAFLKSGTPHVGQIFRGTQPWREIKLMWSWGKKNPSPNTDVNASQSKKLIAALLTS